jgi:hypothetical protein
VIKPLLEIEAMLGLLLVHTPPVVGDNCVVEFMHIEAGPLRATIGSGLIKIGVVGKEVHPVAEEVNVNATWPGLSAVISPALVMVAILELTVVQVPASGDEMVVVSPIHNTEATGLPITGLLFTGITGDGSDTHPVARSVKVNCTLPTLNAVTNPALVILATAGFELVQLPPAEGVKLAVLPIHNWVVPLSEIPGLGLMVRG